MSEALAVAPRPMTLVEKTGARFGVDPNKLLATMKATCFKQPGKRVKRGNEWTEEPAPEVSNEQMMALLVVADQYGLNPFTKEIYAFADKGGIVPVVGVDGWIRLMNEHAANNGITFDYGPTVTINPTRTKPGYSGAAPTVTEFGPFTGPEWVEAVIYRTDRAHAIRIREYLHECVRDTDPWRVSTSRMLRHRALIQGARVAFGFAGFHDEEDALTMVSSSPDPLPVLQAKKQTDRIGGRLGLVAAQPVESVDLSTEEDDHPEPVERSAPATRTAPSGATTREVKPDDGKLRAAAKAEAHDLVKRGAPREDVRRLLEDSGVVSGEGIEAWLADWYRGQSGEG